TEMEKILVIQTAFIGDAVLTLPMIEKLKEMKNSSIIDVVSIPSTSEIFNSSPFVNEVLLLEKRGKHKSFRGLKSFSNEIKRRNYSRIYSPHRSFRTAIIIMLSGVRETYGFSNSSLKYVYKNIIEYNTSLHEVQRNFDLIGYKYSEDNWKILPKIKASESAKFKVNDYFETNKITNGFVAVSPGSVWATKRYPIEYFIEVISSLVKEGKQVLLIGGDNDKEITFKIKENFKENVFDSTGLFSLVESIELIKHASLLITNDSAPTHLGISADIKVLTLYCSTVPEFGFYPYNKLSGYLSVDDLYCKPCGIHGFDECPIKTFDCGKKLIPETIIKKIKN
ncbi:MAG: glycosyltransferase family 9 protein, partial [Ignavibacteriaceae bacterium]|nr:glycosyltransferase family 9 protein [Ignavibacteriaceae bacterium]